jgi:hypothetical protein
MGQDWFNSTGQLRARFENVSALKGDALAAQVHGSATPGVGDQIILHDFELDGEIERIAPARAPVVRDFSGNIFGQSAVRIQWHQFSFPELNCGAARWAVFRVQNI